MSNKQVIFEATIGLVSDQVEAAPAVDRAWQEFKAAFRAVDDALAGAGLRQPLSFDLEAAVNAYAGEVLRAAFVVGLAFDAEALLLEAAAGG